MIIRELRSRRSVAQTVTGLDVKQWPRAVYIKVTVVSLTTSGPTAQAGWLVCQLASLVVTRTGLGNLLGK